MYRNSSIKVDNYKTAPINHTSNHHLHLILLDFMKANSKLLLGFLYHSVYSEFT